MGLPVDNTPVARVQRNWAGFWIRYGDFVYCDARPLVVGSERLGGAPCWSTEFPFGAFYNQVWVISFMGKFLDELGIFSKWGVIHTVLSLVAVGVLLPPVLDVFGKLGHDGPQEGKLIEHFEASEASVFFGTLKFQEQIS